MSRTKGAWYPLNQAGRVTRATQAADALREAVDHLEWVKAWRAGQLQCSRRQQRYRRRRYLRRFTEEAYTRLERALETPGMDRLLRAA